MAELEGLLELLKEHEESTTGCQQMVFNIGEDLVGINILNIKEIIRYIEPSKVPNTPKFVKGVINFRGEIIPLINPNVIFGLEDSDYSEVVLVVEAEHKTYGMFIDKVLDIVSFADEEMQEVPNFGKNEKMKYVTAIGKKGDKVVLLMDVIKLINFEAAEETMKKMETNRLKEKTKNKNTEEETISEE